MLGKRREVKKIKQVTKQIERRWYGNIINLLAKSIGDKEGLW
jgi:hypothetical protein